MVSFLPLGDLKEAVDFKITWLDLLGDIRIKDKELDVIISADDGRGDEYLACNEEDTTDDVIIGDDDIKAGENEVSIVDEKEA